MTRLKSVRERSAHCGTPTPFGNIADDPSAWATLLVRISNVRLSRKDFTMLMALVLGAHVKGLR